MVKFVLATNIFRISMLLWLQIFCNVMKQVWMDRPGEYY